MKTFYVVPGPAEGLHRIREIKGASLPNGQVLLEGCHSRVPKNGLHWVYCDTRLEAELILLEKIRQKREHVEAERKELKEYEKEYELYNRIQNIDDE